jgi:hypothetical protein
MVLTSAPGSPSGQQALVLAESLADQGHSLTLCCLQDAVVLGSRCPPRAAHAALERLLDREARCLVLEADLILRGLEPGRRASALDHAGVVGLLSADHDRVIGAL